jgi:hypothetical protein
MGMVWLARPESGPPATLEAEHAWYERTKKNPNEIVWSIETKAGHLLGNLACHRGFRSDTTELDLFKGHPAPVHFLYRARKKACLDEQCDFRIAGIAEIRSHSTEG